MNAPEPDQEAVSEPPVVELHALQRAADRIARLQSVTAALSESLTPAQVGAVVVEEGVAALEARAGSMALLTEDGAELEVVRAVGYPEAVVQRWRRFPVDAPVPLADAVRTAKPVFLENREAWLSRYPDIDGNAIRDHHNEAWAALPLVAENRTIGAIGLTFPHPSVFREEDRGFMSALAHQCAQALERARLYEEAVKALGAVEAAQKRMAFLAEVSAVVAASLDPETTLAAVSRLVVPTLADWCAIDIQREDGVVERLAVAHVNPAKAEIIREAQRHYPVDPHRSHPLLNCLAGQAQFVRDVSDADLQAIAQDADHLHLLRALSLRSYLCVPLTARGRTLGAITLVTTGESGRRFDAEDRVLAEEMARRAALAVDNARLYREAQEEISERKRAEEEMRLIAARAQCILWHSTVEEIGKPWLRWDMHVADLEAAQRFFPLDINPPEMPYTFAWHLAKLPEDKGPMEAYGTAQVRAGKSYSQEFRCRGRDGQVRWFKEDVQIETLAPGRKWRAVGVCTDITERKQTEEAIRESEKRFQVMADTAPVLIWLSGEDARCTYFNKPWLDFTGRTLDQEMGNGWTSGVHPEDLDRCLEIYLAAFQARKPFEMEYRLRRHDGEYRWILDIGTPRFLENRTFAGFIGSCIDVTQRKQAEQSLIENEYRQRVFLRDVLANVTEGKLRLCDTSSDLPEPLRAVAEPIPLSKPTLRLLRHAARDVAAAQGFTPERWNDLVTAVGEASMNAVVHAGGGWGRVYADETGTVQVWVEDTGAGIDMERLPRATLERGYTTAGSLGHGFWMMLRTADRVWLLTGPQGTTVVLEQSRAEPEPPWLADAV